MLKIALSQTAQGITFILSGRLVGPWVQEFRQCWLEVVRDKPARCHVDLRDVTFIDAAGVALLSQMSRQGITMQASGCMNRVVVQNLGTVNEQETTGPRGEGTSIAI